MYRKTYAIIDNSKIKNNIKEIKTKYSNYKYYIGVVKNRAYHHGLGVIPALIASGINYLAVSSLDEAMEIRKTYDIPILVLEPISGEFIDIAIKNNITLTIDSLEYFKLFIKEYCNISKKLKVHLKIDSGMNRLGFKNKAEINEVYVEIKKYKSLELEGIYTQFATSGREDPFYMYQLEKVKALLEDIDLSKIPIVHFDRSITFVSHEKIDIANGIRLGIVMYGYSASTKYSTSFKSKLRRLKRKLLGIPNPPYISENNLKLEKAFSLYSNVLATRKVKKGERVGYNARYVMPDDGYIATIAIGNGDGITSSFKYVYINGKKYEIVSDSMDMIMVKVDSSVSINDEVEIIGPHIKLNDIQKELGVNAYHLFNMISFRVPRIYKD